MRQLAWRNWLLGGLVVFATSVQAGRCQSPMHYRPVAVEQILAKPAEYAGMLVLVSGRFEPTGSAQLFVEGSIVSASGARLRVSGPVFDWVPQPFSQVEVWGRIGQDERGVYLDFFNGRAVGQKNRQPYVMPPLADGGTVIVVGKLRQVGSEPFVRWILETEDRRAIEVLAFPPQFQPLAGIIVEAEGVVRLGGIPPVVARFRIDRITVRPGFGAVPLGG